MIFRDHEGFVVDSNQDGGDSANRAGLLALFGKRENLQAYEVRPGILVRHPGQEPWTNPRNFSRDQLLPYTAGAWKLGHWKLNQRIFWRHLKRGFFAQNFERDARGTRKRPWPSVFTNDKGEKEFRIFDFADPLGPSDIWHLILCAQLRWLYWFALVGVPALVFAILSHGLLNHSDDEGQIVAKAIVGGPFFKALYKLTNRNWKESLRRYWIDRRQMPEMYELFLMHL